MDEVDDRLFSWFQAGLHDVLERILLSLPAKDMRTVQEVSPNWRTMINFYLESKNPRLVKIRSQRLRQEWTRNDPIVEKINLKLSLPDCRDMQVTHMVADNEHIAVAAVADFFLSTEVRSFVFVVDARSLEVVKVLDVDNRDGLTNVLLAMNDKYLAANVIYFTPTSEDTQNYLTVWLREKNYRRVDQSFKTVASPAMCGDFDRRILIPTSMKETPCLSNTGFYSLCSRSVRFYGQVLPLQIIGFNHFEEVSCEHFAEREEVTFEKETRDYFVEFQILPGPRETIRALLLESGNRRGIELPEGQVSLLRENRDNVIWERKLIGRRPKLVGHDENFSLVLWTDDEMDDAEVEVLSLADGSVVGSVNCRFEFSKVHSGQASDGRLALIGRTENDDDDVIVWDLESGDAIFQCSDFLDCEEPFFVTLLQKNRILFCNYGTVYVASFWV